MLTGCSENSPQTSGNLAPDDVFSGGTPDIDDGVYEHMKRLWDEECASKESEGYLADVLNQGKKKE